MKNLVLVLLISLISSVTYSQINYNEATNGDLPDIAPTTADFTLGIGTNIWQGSLEETGNPGALSDQFFFLIPANVEIISITYSGPSNNVNHTGFFQLSGIDENNNQFYILEDNDGQFSQTYSPGVRALSPTTLFGVVINTSFNVNPVNWSLTIVTNELNTPPSITCPSNIVKNNDQGVCGAVVNYTAPTVIDNAPGATITLTSGLGSGATFPVDETTETFTVTDAEGLSASCSFTVTVKDNEPPVVDCKDFSADLDETGQWQITTSYVLNNAYNSRSDNCGFQNGINVSLPVIYTCDYVGPQNLTIYTIDQSGNQTPCTVTLTINDPFLTCNQPPVASCQNITVVVDEQCQASITPDMVNNNSSDPDNDPLTLALNNSGPFGLGTHTVTLSVSDGQETSTCNANVTVIDITTAIQNIESSDPDNSICNGQTITLSASGGSSGPGTTIKWYSGPNGTGTALGSGPAISVTPSTTMMYYARRENACGATADKSITINVNDITFSILEDHPFHMDETCPNANDGVIAVKGFGRQEVDDPNNIATYDYSKDGGINWFSQSVSDVYFFANLTAGTYSIKVRDANHPACVSEPQDYTLNTTNTESTPLTAFDLSVNPVCPGENTVISVSGGVDGTGAEVKWYTEPNGGGLNFHTGYGPITITSSNAQTNFYVRREGDCNTTEDLVVTIDGDTEPPTLICQDYQTNLGPGGNIMIDPSDVTAVLTDNCLINSHNVSPNNFSAEGIFNVTVSATDYASPPNTSTCTAQVTVEKRPTTLTNLSVFTGQYTEIVTLSAQLTDDLDGNSGIANKNINFSLGAFNTSAITNASGIASVNVTLNQIPGNCTFTTTFDGDGTYKISNDSDPFTITRASTSLTNLSVFSGQYSDVVTLKAQLMNAVNNTPLTGESITFEIAGLPAANGTTDANGMVSVQLKLDQAPGIYNWTTSYAGSTLYLSSLDNDNFNIMQEDATITYTGAYFASTAGQNSSNAIVTLAATIQDAMDGPGNEGDISNATVTFVDRNGGVIATGLPVILINPGDPSTGSVVYNWETDIGSQDAATYDIGIIIGGYYLRDAADDDEMVTVSKPLDNFATGGGYIIMENSGGTLAADDATKMNFGFNVKFNPSGNKPKGKVNFTFRRTESDGILHTYQVKSNKINSVAFDPNNTAFITVNGKCNITDVTEPNNPVSLGGNRTFQLNGIDNGNPGVQNDLIGITVYGNGGGLILSSNWTGVETTTQLLNGGNIKVQTSSSGGNGNNRSINDSKPVLESQKDRLSTITDFQLFPNPVKEQLHLRFACETAERLHIEIININGAIVYAEKMHSTKGENTLSMDVSQLHMGTYSIRISGKELILTKQFIRLSH